MISKDNFIARHNTGVSPSDRNVKRYESEFNQLFKDFSYYKIKYNEIDFSSVFNFAFRLASKGVLFNRSRVEIFTSAFYALQFGINHFNLSTHIGSEVQLEVGELKVTTLGKKAKGYLGTDVWRCLFYLAVALRHKTSLVVLNSVPNEFMKGSNVTYNEVDFAVVEIMKSLGDEKKMQKKIEYYWQIEPTIKHETEGRKIFDSRLTSPALKVLEAIFSKNDTLFNLELERALKKHYEFYNEKRKDHGGPGDPFGWVSYMLLWICAYAYDSNIKVEVESDYIPRWIVEGDFGNCELLAK